jgi:hypothetical protein
LNERIRVAPVEVGKKPAIALKRRTVDVLAQRIDATLLIEVDLVAGLEAEPLADNSGDSDLALTT